MRLEGKVAIVTGGSRGIGRGCVELFAAEGARVIAADVSKPDRPFEAEGITYRELDVTDLESWGRVVNSILEDEGRLDILVNNAGTVGSYDPIHEISLDDWERVIELNQHAVFYGMRTVIPSMRERGGGSIINISSIWGIAGAAGVAAYQASKGAVRLMSKNAALSYVDDGIRVNSVHPGIIDTPMIEAQDAEITAAVVEATPMKRLGTPRELAYGALYLASDESSFVTGTELVIDGGYTTQ
jgi:NAD(P)-dependent dehydrogenase (short-subunit alcohol dehydrogenase family)